MKLYWLVLCVFLFIGFPGCSSSTTDPEETDPAGDEVMTPEEEEGESEFDTV